MKDLADFYEEIGEDNEEWNARQREKIRKIYTETGYAWLGNINLHDTGKPPIWLYNGDFVHNFEAAFVIPYFDQKLWKLILERDHAPYTGTKDDARRITRISKRIETIGGYHLLWS